MSNSDGFFLFAASSRNCLQIQVILKASASEHLSNIHKNSVHLHHFISAHTYESCSWFSTQHLSLGYSCVITYCSRRAVNRSLLSLGSIGKISSSVSGLLFPIEKICCTQLQWFLNIPFWFIKLCKHCLINLEKSLSVSMYHCETQIID